MLLVLKLHPSLFSHAYLASPSLCGHLPFLSQQIWSRYKTHRDPFPFCCGTIPIHERGRGRWQGSHPCLGFDISFKICIYSLLWPHSEYTATLFFWNVGQPNPNAMLCQGTPPESTFRCCKYTHLCQFKCRVLTCLLRSPRWLVQVNISLGGVGGVGGRGWCRGVEGALLGEGRKQARGGLGPGRGGNCSAHCILTSLKGWASQMCAN